MLTEIYIGTLLLDEELAAFKKKHGRCRVSEELGASHQLVNWCNYQRQKNEGAHKKYGQLSQERIDNLGSIGFPWSLR